MNTTQQARLPASAEFDAKIAKMYNKALAEVNKHLKTSVATFNLDINKILLPTSNESDEKRLAKQFTKKRLKILDSIDTLVRNLTFNRNRIQLFGMFDTKNQKSALYLRRYNRIKMMALNRLETGVSLLKFERQQDMPLATILFPSRNTKIYTIRYEILKHMLLNKINKGVHNLSFVAETFFGRVKKKLKLEKNKAEVPIEAFLIPTPNSNLLALRYNWTKQVMLSKIHKGVKNLSFVATDAQDYTRLNGSHGTKMKKLTTKLDVPIDSFLIPSGNTWYYALKYKLLKLKFLKKVKKGIKSIKFTGGTYDIFEKFMPDASNNDNSSYISKAIGKAIGRISRSTVKAISNQARLNEYTVYKQQERFDKRLQMDEERNKILIEILKAKFYETQHNRGYSYTGSEYNSGYTDNKYNTNEYDEYKQRELMLDMMGLDKKRNVLLSDLVSKVSGNNKISVMKQSKDGIWKPNMSSTLSSLVESIPIAIVAAVPTIAAAMGPAFAVAAAGVLGYELGKWIDNKLGISDAIAEATGGITDIINENEEIYQQVRNEIEPSVKKDSLLNRHYRGVLDREAGIVISNRDKINAFRKAKELKAIDEDFMNDLKSMAIITKGKEGNYDNLYKSLFVPENMPSSDSNIYKYNFGLNTPSIDEVLAALVKKESKIDDNSDKIIKSLDLIVKGLEERSKDSSIKTPIITPRPNPGSLFNSIDSENTWPGN